MLQLLLDLPRVPVSFHIIIDGEQPKLVTLLYSKILLYNWQCSNKMAQSGELQPIFALPKLEEREAS